MCATSGPPTESNRLPVLRGRRRAGGADEGDADRLKQLVDGAAFTAERDRRLPDEQDPAVRGEWTAG